MGHLDKGSVTLDGMCLQNFDCSSDWRKRFQYVTQYKVDIPGTPRDFINRATSFNLWKTDSWPTEYAVLQFAATELVERLGFSENCLNKEWSMLSDGEVKRVILALSLGSKPSVLLSDKSTSVFDVERTIDDLTREKNLKALWVLHDHGIF